MSRKKSESPQKKAYRLWWEYLKFSQDYRGFCDWMGMRSKDANLPIPKQSNWFVLWEGFKFFGNVFMDSFKEWWEVNKEKLGKGKEEGFPEAIEDYTKFVMGDMEDIIQEFRKRTGREPSIEEFKKSFAENLNFPELRFYFMVSASADYQFKDWGKLFIAKLRKKIEDYTKTAECVKQSETLPCGI